MSNLSIECSGVYPTLAVPNVEDTCNWYIETLGFKLSFLWGAPVTHGAIMFGNASVHFWTGPSQATSNWLYFDIDNVDAMYQRAKGNGVQITKAPDNYPWGMREFNAVDPNGYNIRFGQHVGTQDS